MAKQKDFTATISAAVCAVLLSACGGDQTAQPSAAETSSVLQPVTLAELEQRIGEDAVLPMTRDKYPDTFRKLGASQFRRANDLTRWAALAAAEHRGMCDSVALIAVSDAATRDQIIWFADCDNGQRIMINDDQAEDVQRRFREQK